MKHPALKMFIVSVCFLPFILLAGELPAPTNVEVIKVVYKESSTVLITTISAISKGVLTAIGVYRWKKR